MKFMMNELGIRVDFNECLPLVLSIERSDVFCDLVREIMLLVEGNSDRIIIQRNAENLNLNKLGDFIMNPFALDINQKKIIGKIHKDLTQVANEELYVESSELSRVIIDYLDNLLQRLPYDLVYEAELDILTLLKAFGVKLDDSDMEFLSRIICYVKAMHRICGVEIFFFLNIKQFLSSEQVAELYKSCCYEQVSLILLEGCFRERAENESNLIIDKDYCIINID